jgi:hypothetical protein
VLGASPGSYRPDLEAALIWLSVRLEITPEPTPAERAAIERAVAATTSGSPPVDAVWRRRGREEAVAADEDSIDRAGDRSRSGGSHPFG